MEHDPINIDEFSIPKDNVPKETMMRATPLVEMRVTTTSLVGDQLKLTFPKVIASVIAWFKRKKVYIPVKFSVVALVVKASPVMTIPIPSPLISVIDTSLVVETFIQGAF
jgi:hypothetical protein